MLWRAWRCFGSLVDLPPQARRRLVEHIQASGRYLWDTGHRRHLLAAQRRRLLRALLARHPGWRDLPTEEQSRRLAERTKLATGDLLAALQDTDTPRRDAFVKLVRLRQTLGRQL